MMSNNPSTIIINSNSSNSNSNSNNDLGKATSALSSSTTVATSEFQTGGNNSTPTATTIDCVPFINTWMTPLPNTNNSINSNSNSNTLSDQISSTTKFEHLTMPVNQAALEAAVYGSSGASGGIQNGASTNPYCTPIGYNNSAAAAAAAYANPYHYHMAFRNAAPLTNYFNTLGSAATVAAANVGNSGYYSGYANPTTGFDYNSYATSNQYYNNSSSSSSNINSSNNSRAVAAANNYYNATAAAAAFPYGTLGGTETLPTSSTTLISASQISPYSTAITQQKAEHKPPRRNKKKKPIGGLASPEPSYARVFVYELEDLCSFVQPPSYFAHFGLLLDNIISQAFGIHLDECDQANVEDANVDDITDLSYSNNQTENNVIVDEQKPDINSLSESPPINAVNRGIADGLQQMARRYQRMKDIYNKCKDNIGELTNYMPQYSSEQIIGWIKQHDVFVENYRQCLRITIERSTEMERFTNVVISSESLASTMAKLLLCNLAAYIPVENIYSSHKIGKAEILDRASLRFKKNMIIASSIPETREISKKERIPVWPIRNLKDIDTYYHAIDKVLTMS